MFVYIDESGHPHPKDPCERPVYVAVCVPALRVRSLMAALYRAMKDLEVAMDRELSDKEREGKATALLNRRNLLGFPAKREYVETVMDHVRSSEMAIFAMVMERPTKKPYDGDDLLQTPDQWLLERIDWLIEERYEGTLATLVFDGRSRLQNKRLDACFSGFLFRSRVGRGMTSIVPNVLFVDSELTPGIKIADMCAYILRVDYEQGLDRGIRSGDPYLSAIARYAQIIRGKTVDFDVDGQTHWGIRTMGEEHFIYDPPDHIREAVPAEARG
ncbi:MAG TPA: DUF3800 domain-containing protein [Longimicrobiales bacterium]